MFKPSTIIAVLLTLAIGAWLYSGEIVIGGQGAQDNGAPQDDPETAEPATAVPVRVARVDARDRYAEVTLRGRSEAEDMVDVRAETTGLVERVAVTRGDAVARGDILCQIEPGAREATLLQWQAQYEQADADYAAAAQLAESGFAAETRVRALRAARDAALAGVHQAELDLQRTKVRAPFDGTVERLPADPGHHLQVGDICAMVVDTDPMLIVTQASEREVGHLAEGLDAKVTLVDGSETNGKISFIARTADEATRTFRVEVTVDNADGAIKSGLTSRITVTLPPVQAHYVPPSALSLADNGEVGVKIVEDGVARFLPVALLADDRDGVWIGGLPDAIDLIVVGGEYVTDGTPVDVSMVSPGAGS